MALTTYQSGDDHFALRFWRLLDRAGRRMIVSLCDAARIDIAAAAGRRMIVSLCDAARIDIAAAAGFPLFRDNLVEALGDVWVLHLGLWVVEIC